MVPNPITQILTLFVDELTDRTTTKAHTTTEIAQKIGISREGLRKALSPHKKVESFKMGTLLKITEVFPITIRISEGQIETFRWDIIQAKYREKENQTKSVDK